MRQRKWTVDYMKDINWVCKFIHKYLKLEPEEKLVSTKHEDCCASFCALAELRTFFLLFQFLYVNQTFAPSPDQNLKNLYECYGNQNKLTLHYSISQAWG